MTASTHRSPAVSDNLRKDLQDGRINLGRAQPGEISAVVAVQGGR